MVEKGKHKFHLSYQMTATTFLLIVIIITGTLFAFPLVFSRNHTAMAQHQLNGNSFQLDNMTFSHNTASVNGIQLHYVIGGHGNPVVLLHGWPETWYAWHKVMPALAKNYTVIAPDLRGLGDSSKPPTGYDGKTVAEDIHQLVTKLGFKTIFLVGHDIGTQVAYSYAAAHPTQVKKLVVMELTIPGFAPAGRMPLWWVVFHQTPDIPEALVQGKELIYLSWFYRGLAYNPSAITQADINEFVSHYSAPGGMRAGFEYYRAFPQDAIQNQNYSKTKLTMPVLALGGGYIPTLGGNITMPTVIYGMKILAQNVQGVTVPNSGHFIPEEQPVFLLNSLNNFFSGNTTTETSK
ncbi:MAG: alpha/beta hydrolase [Nitrososphaeraceae archaeon]|nr:alpha/beta hydrolase [Nitrososphaeraceae archaeon]